MRPHVDFPDVDRTVHAVCEEMRQTGLLTISPRPWNHYSPSMSPWWIMPTKEFPAYHRGKFIFEPDEDNPATLFAGVHLEKGFGKEVESIADTAAAKRFIMQDDWMWHKVFPALDGGEFANCCENIATSTGLVPVVRLGAGNWVGSDSEPYWHGNNRGDGLVFYWANGKLRLDSERSLTPQQVLEHAKSISDFAGLKEAIAVIPRSEWIWVNLYIGCEFQFNTGTVASGWSASRLWKQLLTPLARWFR